MTSARTFEAATQAPVPARTSHEAGQGMVEFALIAFPLLLLIAGIIQFGIALTFWHDQQRLTTAGARVAVVNCAAASWCSPTLEDYLESAPLAGGNRPDAKVCFVPPLSGPGGTQAQAGDIVRVTMSMPFKLVPIFGIGEIDLSAKAEMRLEQNATHSGIASVGSC